MVRLDDDSRTLLTAIWRAGAKNRRDVNGKELLVALDEGGASMVDERRLLDLMRGLRDDGIIEVHIGGSHRVADMALIRLTREAREAVADFPEVGGGGLEPEQEQLLVEIVEATNNAPRSKQHWHLGGEYIGPNGFQGPWGVREVLPDDIHTLDRLGFLKATHLNYVYGNDYVVTLAGRRYYAALKERATEPVERQEQQVRQFLASDLLRELAPAAYEKWSEAEKLLWAADSEKELTTIGHKVREAMQAFATALVERHRPQEVNPDPTKTLDRVSAVLMLYRPSLGERRTALFDALFGLWRAAVELVQRQEHGGQKENEPLEWQDGRRVVLQAAVVMYEIATALPEPPENRS